MVLQRPVSKVLACHGCQQWMLRSFISAVSGALLVQQRRTSLPSPRPFSTTHRGRNEIRRSEHEDERPLNDINNTTYTPTPELTPQPQSSPLPWYLQQQPPIQRQNPLSTRQELPPLPLNPPPILQPLLIHLSQDLGIEDLSLLDLRGLDPPPALGSNLLMAVGTARSEKHLHTSADRFCRWLRSEYRLSPHADGLLGRNELKLKLKRRAKRSKLLSAVGAKATALTEVDEGIRTGWVCVNVGRVEGGEVSADGRSQRVVVGFGGEETGCSVVVQLLTEEKRGELDLEGIWEEVRMARRKREGGQLAATAQENREVGGASVFQPIESVESPVATQAT